MKVTRAIGLLMALLVFLIDQGTKLGVVRALGVNHDIVKNYLANRLSFDGLGYEHQVLPIFDLRFVPNVGVSLGMLAADGPLTRWALVAFTAAIAAGVVWWMLRERKLPDVMLLGMVLGGAMGNILDRSRLGYVVDFADLHFGAWRPFLVFNVADAGITIGVVILLIRALFVRDKPVVPSDPVPDSVEKNVNA